MLPPLRAAMPPRLPSPRPPRAPCLRASLARRLPRDAHAFMLLICRRRDMRLTRCRPPPVHHFTCNEKGAKDMLFARRLCSCRCGVSCSPEAADDAATPRPAIRCRVPPPPLLMPQPRNARQSPHHRAHAAAPSPFCRRAASATRFDAAFHAPTQEHINAMRTQRRERPRCRQHRHDFSFIAADILLIPAVPP